MHCGEQAYKVNIHHPPTTPSVCSHSCTNNHADKLMKQMVVLTRDACHVVSVTLICIVRVYALPRVQPYT